MRKKKEKKKGKGYKFIGILLILSSLALLGVVLYVNILPMKYLLYLVGGLFIVNLLINFFLFKTKVKKKHKKFMTFLAILFTIIFGIGTFFIYKTFGVIETMSKDTKIYTYHVVVKNESSYQNIIDIQNKTLGFYNNNSNSIKKAQTVLKNKVITTNESYGNLESLGTDLLNNDVDAVLLEDGQKTMLNNSTSSTLSKFSSGTRVLYTFKVEAKIDSKEVDVTKDVFNVYISGMDEYGTVSEISRSDVNIILTINPKTKQILITNIPRDYYVQLHDTTGYKDKLTHAGIYGIDTSVKTLEDLLGIEINYYIKVNFSSLENIIDALGGVEVYSEYSFQSWNGYNFKKGYNKITNGKQGLAFCRERHSFNDGDNQRGKNQQAMIDAIFRKCTSTSVIPKYNSLLNSLKNSMITNMSTKSMTKLAKMQLKDNATWKITSQQVKGIGSSDYTYTYPYQLLYVTKQDDKSIEEVKEKITKVANGEVLEATYESSSTNAQSVTKSYVAKKKTTTKKKTTKKVVKKKEEVSPVVPPEEPTEPAEPTEPTEPVEPVEPGTPEGEE